MRHVTASMGQMSCFTAPVSMFAFSDGNPTTLTCMCWMFLQGYDLGNVPEDLTGMGDAIIKALQAQEQNSVVMRGAAAAEGVSASHGLAPSGAPSCCPAYMLSAEADQLQLVSCSISAAWLRH